MEKSRYGINIRHRNAVLTAKDLLPAFRQNECNVFWCSKICHMMYKDTPNPAQQIFVHKKHRSRSPGFMGHVSYPAVHEFDYLVFTGIEFCCKGDVLLTEVVHSQYRI